ncbi:hypothetical protein [Roseateles violae]|uniref:STAS/SEC14 domain-containing protein n=1 Tax=Roseateles violae TaxID=3058042 RepID=A0ABT8DN19_9BURK|nr:hypothetical protein [Pelomonas sp. PFR6]MDN3919522.1 hypothetical protein [Pelomonas sp. PFR6]
MNQHSNDRKPAKKRSIDAYASSAFRPHGRIEFWAEGPVIRIAAEGPFNREAVQAVGLAMRDLFATMPPAPRFADLLEFRGSLLASPDALAAFGDFLAAMSAAKTAPIAVAFVVAPEVEGRSLMLPIFAKLYAEHRRQFSAFETSEAAEAWLRERLGA